MVQIEELQDKVNSWNDAEEFYDPEKLRAALDYPTFPVKPMSIPSPRRMTCHNS